ncbi:porin family protein [Aquimarina sediminis]|uniref:porin family protein n=1 Tax=Aquimarina sediminis TaxID=2070536 RepID=UPI000CA02288|nr:porin family protein [Aquimarina sediminis]
MNNILQIVLTFYMIIATQTAFSQAAILAAIFGDKVASEKFNLSLELGVPLNSFSNIENLSSSSGINFGIAGNIKLSKNWYASPTVYFLSKRSAEIEDISLNTTNPNLNSLYQNVNADLLVKYIDVNTFIYYQFNNSGIRIGLSPQVSFRQEATITYKNELGRFEQNINSKVNKIDYGALFNLGYYFKSGNKGKGIMVHFRYYQGFSNVFNNDLFKGNNKSNYFSIHISLPFITEELAMKNLEHNQ